MIQLSSSYHKKAFIGLTVVTLSLTTAPLALAQMGLGAGPPPATGVPGAMRMMPAFTDFDSDGNGQISQSEFEQTRAQRIAERSSQGYQMRGLANAPTFDDLDTDGNGILNEDEFSAGVATHHQAPQQR